MIAVPAVNLAGDMKIDPHAYILRENYQKENFRLELCKKIPLPSPAPNLL